MQQDAKPLSENCSACFLSCHLRTAASPECLPHCWPFFSFWLFTIQVTFHLQTSKALRQSALSSLCIIIVKNHYRHQNCINWYSHNLKLKLNFAFIQTSWAQWRVGVFQHDSFEFISRLTPTSAGKLKILTRMQSSFFSQEASTNFFT
jgi:hypothetical protein